MGSGSKQTTRSNATTSTTPTVPSWLQQPYQSLVGRVGDLASTPATAFTTPATANQNQAFARAGAGTGNPTAGAAAATSNMLGYTPQNVTAGQLSETDLAPYMNPYTREVIDSTISDFERGNGIGLNQLRAATPSGAFNGSRQGVAEATLTGDNSRTLAGTVAGLRRDNFTNAQAGAMGDIASRLQAALANQGADITGANVRLGAADQLGRLNLAGAENTRADTAAMASAGATERAINAENNPNVARLDLYQALMSMLGQSPGMYAGSSGTATGTNTTTNSPGLLDIIGTLAQAVGAAQGGGGGGAFKPGG